MNAPEPVSSRPAAAPAPATRPGVSAPVRPGGSWLAAQGRLPLAFMVAGLGWFGAAAAGMALQPELLAIPHTAPSVIALVHAWVLGFFVTIAVGAMYQLAPVALGTTLWNERAGWCHWALHTAAVPVMVYAFWHWDLPLLVIGGSQLLLGLGFFAVNTGMTVLRSGKRDPVAWSIALATGWLVLTATLGVTLAANRIWNFWPVDPLPLLRAHAHLGLVGFFLTLLQGVTFRLVPMFTLAEVPAWGLVRRGLWLSQVGLLVLAPALAWHHGYVAAAAGAVILLGLLSSGVALRQTFRTRKKRQLDTGVRAFVRGGVGLVAATVTGLWLVWPSTHAGSYPGGLSANVYGVLLLLGALLPAISGMMNKIVPFLTWMRAYGPKVGRTATPPATALSHARLESWAMTTQTAALLPLVGGAWSLNATVLAAGAALLALGTLLFLGNMALVLRHLWRPVTVVAPAVSIQRVHP